jgi:hypothetical protein
MIIFRKSSRSGGENTDCVEVGIVNGDENKQA